jgi:hypothetical protein
LPWGEEPITVDILGFIERFVIFGAFVMGFGPQAVAGWVTLKTVSQWKGWNERHENRNGTKVRFGEGRARFYLFLVGTSLSIIGAIIGAVFALWLYQPDKIHTMLTFGVSPLNNSSQKP